MPSDPYTDDEYDDTYRKVHGDDPVKDQYTNEATDDTFFPSGVGGSLYPSGWGIWPSDDTVDAEYDQYREGDEYGAREDVPTDGSGDDSWWEEGLISLLLVGGLALFLFPEPATSAVGILMMGTGVVAWLVDWLA